MTLLAGDLGGTKTLLGLYDESGRLLYSQRYESASYSSLDEIVVGFLAESALAQHPRPSRAAFGVAGPVEEVSGQRQRARITNLSWEIDTAGLEAIPDMTRVRLYNDFYTVAAATPFYHQTEEGAVALNPSGRAQPLGALAVLGAGTGLGEAIVARSSGTLVILPTEGGHSDFAARDEVEIALLRFLQDRHGPHISYERVLCGAGLLALYEFFREFRGAAQEPEDLRRARAEDPGHAPALISQHGLQGSDATCAEALGRFVEIYGAEAGNLALKAMATGGVYLAGGIAAKILPRLRTGLFMEAFTAKGRFSSLLASIPVHVIINPEIGLLGASVLATTL